MILVPGGIFLYGDNQKLPLPSFYMDKFEVTTKRYAEFLQETGRMRPADWDRVNLVSDGDKPVMGVSWQDADFYCSHYGKRLPTEQEWEKAARGTDGRKYPWGSKKPTSRHAHFDKCCVTDGYKVLAPIGSYEAGKSPYGIYDMAGNVWEWTRSDYGPDSKVIRGGSWMDDGLLLASTYRTGWVTVIRDNPIGFRCSMDAPK